MYLISDNKGQITHYLRLVMIIKKCVNPKYNVIIFYLLLIYFEMTLYSISYFNSQSET